jgi:hypothetical protein
MTFTGRNIRILISAVLAFAVLGQGGCIGGTWDRPPLSETFYPAFSNEAGLWGYIDSSGNWAITPRYAVVYPFSERLAVAVDPWTGLWGAIDQSGDWVVEPVFAYMSSFLEGLAVARGEGSELYGFVDHHGVWVLPPRYWYADGFNNGYAVVSGGATGVYSTTDGSYIREYTEYWDVIDISGATVYQVEGFVENSVTSSYHGCVVTPFIHHGAVNVFSYGYYDGSEYYSSHQECRLMNSTGQVVYESTGSYSILLSGGLAIVIAHTENGGQFGCIDYDGNWVIEPQDGIIKSYNDGVAVVIDSVTGGYGCIDTEGSWLVLPVFYEVRAFSEAGLSFATSSGSYLQFGEMSIGGSLTCQVSGSYNLLQ